MANEELNTAVYEKLYAEQDAFRNQLLAMPPEEILSHAYEYVQREDLLLSLEYNGLTDRQMSRRPSARMSTISCAMGSVKERSWKFETE